MRVAAGEGKKRNGAVRHKKGDLAMQILTGIGWHMVGAASAASFYAPISKVKKWTWESTWAVMGVFSWFLLPIGVSAYLLPHFSAFYSSLDSSVVLRSEEHTSELQSL